MEPASTPTAKRPGDPFDAFGSFHEEWIVRLGGDENENDPQHCNNIHTPTTSSATRTILQLARLANLRCALGEKEGTNHHSSSSIEALLVRAQDELDRDTNHHNWLLSNLSIPQPQNTTTTTTNHKKNTNTCTSRLDLDAFFEEYPECHRTNPEQSDDDDDEDSNESDQEEKEKHRRRSRQKRSETSSAKEIVDLVAAASEPSQQQQPRPNRCANESQQQQQPSSRPLSANNNHSNIIPRNPYSHLKRQSQSSNGGDRRVNDDEPSSSSSFAYPQSTTTTASRPTSTHPNRTERDPSFVRHESSTSTTGNNNNNNSNNGGYRGNAVPRNNNNNNNHNNSRPIDPNPYKRSMQQDRLPPPNNPYASSNNPYNGSSNNPYSNNNNDAWMDHRNQTNPFQTAREVAEFEQANPHKDPFRNNNNSRQPQPPQRGRQQQQQLQHDYPDPNNHFKQNEEEPSLGPYIPDSLKRKFQPPVKRGLGNLSQHQSRASSNNNNNNNNRSRPKSNNNNHNSSSNHRPSSSGGQTTKRNNNNNNNGEDDEEELPEALQHLDKELVKKIQNEIMESGDSITFDDIAGLEDAKATVQEVVCWPMKRPDLFTGLRRAPNGLLLYGPPGTGKTLIGKAIAHESGATFFSISSSSLTSKWIGEGEKLVKTLFAVASFHEPAVVFIDEIDSLLTQRKSTENEASRRIKTEFLVQLDGTGTTGRGRVLIIGATNRPQELDEAARRRFTKRLYIPLPVEDDRRILLQVLLKTNNHVLTDADIDTLAKDTKGFSGADLKSLCTDAAMGPIRQLGAKAMQIGLDEVPPISYKHFKKSLKGTKPSVAPEDLKQYIEWDQTYGTKRYDEDEEDDDDED